MISFRWKKTYFCCVCVFFTNYRSSLSLLRVCRSDETLQSRTLEMDTRGVGRPRKGEGQESATEGAEGVVVGREEARNGRGQQRCRLTASSCGCFVTVSCHSLWTLVVPRHRHRPFPSPPPLPVPPPLQPPPYSTNFQTVDLERARTLARAPPSSL